MILVGSLLGAVLRRWSRQAQEQVKEGRGEGGGGEGEGERPERGKEGEEGAEGGEGNGGKEGGTEGEWSSFKTKLQSDMSSFASLPHPGCLGNRCCGRGTEQRQD